MIINELSHRFTCPYCGQFNECEIDAAEIGQVLIQDCQICCQPIEIEAQYDPNSATFFIQIHTDRD